jgi:Ca2+-binding RTX toxin-like protein
MAGGRGRDTFHPGAGGGVVDGGGGGFERVYLHAGGRWFISDNQAHRISGAPVVVSFTAIEEVEIRGGGGADHINARAFDGYTVIYGKKGNDTILAGPFGNWLVGGRGHDTLSGGRGDDELQGRRGHDVLWGRRGSDVIKGGPGVDHCRGGGGPDDIQDCSP